MITPGKTPIPLIRNVEASGSPSAIGSRKLNAESHEDRPIELRLGREELVIRRRYETASIFNDFLIAIWFLVGSVFFLYPALEKAGIWLFIIGSAQFLVRPLLRLAHRLSIQRAPASNWDM